MYTKVDRILHAIMQGTEPCTGATFFQALVQNLAQAMDMKYAFIAEIVPATRDDAATTVRTLASWTGLDFEENFAYALAGTPCELVVGGETLQINENVGARFPTDDHLAELGAESYYGLPLVNDAGVCLGHLAVLDDKPVSDVYDRLSVLRTFAARALAELERAHLENQLREAERHFRLLFEASPNPVILFDLETWKPLVFNDQAADFMGYTRAAFAQLTITDLEVVPNPEETREHVEQIRRTGGDTFEAYHKTKQGAPVHVIVTLCIVPWHDQDVMLTIWHDITERKQMEAALRESEARFSRMVESAMDAIVTLDGQRRVLLFNKAAEQVFQCEVSGILQQPFDPLLSEGFSDVLAEAMHDRKQPDQQYLWTSEGLTAVRANGQSFPIEATLSSFEWAGERLYTLILRDVDARQRAEVRIKKLEAENLRLQTQLVDDGQHGEIISRSSSMWKVPSQAERVAVTDATVLLRGETGTGKELFARKIHKRSARGEQVLIVVNCAALPKDLIESELFGHEKGAFTGAGQRKKGRFELADGGTIFLDEVGEFSLEAQAKLLRVLQESEIQRVGGERTFKVDVRVIAATHRDLKQMVQQGTFREDLYYRLSVFPLHIPPLREHKSDIPLLVDHFVGHFARKFGKPLRGFNAAGMHRLMQYHWQGNVRELQNVVERAAILAFDETLQLDEWFGSDTPAQRTDDRLDAVMRDHLCHVLDKTDWLIEGTEGAAARLGLNPSTLRFRMKKLGIERPA